MEMQLVSHSRAHSSCWLAVLCALGGLLLAGCGREGIRVYSVPKERPTPETIHDEFQASLPQLRWKAPEGWIEQPAGGIRVARFSIPGRAGHDADVSVIPLTGVSAPKVEIVNLWREQIQLPPVKESGLPGMSEKVRIGDDEQGELYDMASEQPLVEDQKARILVAMLERDGAHWFFKMTGPEELVQSQKQAFRHFLESVTFESAKGPRPVPQFTSTNVKEVPAPAAGLPEWQVPASWQEVPPTQMLMAKFLAKSSGEAQVEITVSAFPGPAGGMLPNVNRWRGQINLQPIEDAELKELISSLDVEGGNAMLVDMTGGDADSGTETRIIAAVVPKEGRTWFYKLMGDPQVAEREKAAFIEFVKTIKYTGAG